mmetsp:Transcript_1313/g.3788  ORF Transcript_1313/g.3788 Transcript_1313/m.3788 type:complete len:447 (-) Transcript_1313:71-1411(-)
MQLTGIEEGPNSLLQLLLQDGGEVFRNLERLHGDADGGNAIGRFSINGMLGNALLDSDVVGILGEEVGHGRGILGRELLDQLLVLVVRHVVAERLLATGIRDRGVRVGTTASIGGNRNLLARLSLDSKFDLIEVGVLLPAGSGEGLHGGELLVGRYGFDIVDGHIIEGNQEGKLVDGHILQHTFGVSLEALAKGLGGVLVGIVGDEGDVRSGDGLGKFASLSDVLANVLVVAHEDLDAGILGLRGHLLELGDSGSSGLLEVDALGSVGDRLGQEMRVVGRPAGDEGQARGGGRGQILEAGCELDAVLGLRFGLPFLELRAARSLSARSHEPGLDDEIERSAGALLIEHLDGVVPAHTAVGGAATDEDDLGLTSIGVHGRRAGEGTGGGGSRSGGGGGNTAGAGRRDEGRLAKAEGVGGGGAGGGRGEHGGSGEGIRRGRMPTVILI